MEYIENVYNSLKRYFTALEMTGNYSTQSTLSLVVYTFLVSAILEGPLHWYLEDKDVEVLNKLIDCLSKDKCLISRIVHYGRVGRPRQDYIPGSLRNTEDDIQRFTESDDARVTEPRE